MGSVKNCLRGMACAVLALGGAQAQEQSDAVTRLGEVTVRAQRNPETLTQTHAGGQVARGARLGLLGNRDVMDAPFNQTGYTAELIQNQQAATLGDVLDNLPSVRRSVPGYNVGEQFKVRGFSLADSQTSVNGLYGLVSSYGGTPPLELAERVEVLLGPNALLNGMASVGGNINIVPKRAGDAALIRLTVGLGSDSLWKTHADFGRRWGAQGEWGLRVNASRRSGDTPLRGVSRKDDVGAMALDWRGERVRAGLDVWRSTVENRGGTPIIPGIAATAQAAPQAPKANTTLSQDNYDTNNTTAMFGGEFDINRDWTAYARLGARHNDFAGQAQVLYNVGSNGDGTLLLLNTRADNRARALDAGIHGRVQTGGIHHVLAVGFARQHAEGRQLFNYAWPQVTNIYNPPPVQFLPTPAGIPPKTSETRLSSVTIADTLSMADERVLLTLGARRQSIRADNYNATIAGIVTRTFSYDKSVWTPMLALVVKPFDTLSLYANTIQGLEQGGVVGNQYLNAGEVFAPWKTKQIEVGAKLAAGGATHTLSLFQIKRPSALADTQTVPLPTLRPDGEQRNRGIEWNVVGEPLTGVRVLGGVSYIQGKLTKGNANNGRKAPGVAPLTVNLGAEWDVAPGLAIDGRVIHTGSQYIDNTNTLKIPAWTRLDLGARFTTRVAGRTLMLRAAVRNVAGKNYWEGVYMSNYVSLGAARTFLLSATVDF